MRPESEVQALRAGLTRIADMLSWPADRLYALCESVSHWTPAQQVEHVLLSLDRVLEVIRILEEGEDPRIRPDGPPRLSARAIFLTGKIPRGRARAPDFASPDVVPGRAGLRERYEAAMSRVDDLAPRVATLRSVPRTFLHGVLGRLSATQWLHFARIHTEHHLAIIDDIDRSGQRIEPSVDPLTPLGDVP